MNKAACTPPALSNNFFDPTLQSKIVNLKPKISSHHGKRILA
jgi:hypothetical protein